VASKLEVGAVSIKIRCPRRGEGVKDIILYFIRGVAFL
jgi:hypothetical protein